jgi:4-oxalmesaconate hydratase
MVGAVRGIDPETGYNFDDTKRYIDAADISETEKLQIFSENSFSVFSRLKDAIAA